MSIRLKLSISKSILTHRFGLRKVTWRHGLTLGVGRAHVDGDLVGPDVGPGVARAPQQQLPQVVRQALEGRRQDVLAVIAVPLPLPGRPRRGHRVCNVR